MDAVVSGISGGDSRAVSVRAAFPLMAEMEREHGSLTKALIARRRRGQGPSRLLSFRRGMATLVESLETDLGDRLRGRSAARGLTRRGSRWRIELEGGETIEAEHVALALPAPAAAGLIGAVVPDLARALETIPYAGLAVVALAYRAEDLARPLDGYGYLVTRAEGIATLGVVWESSLFEERAPAGHVLVRAMVGGPRRPEAADLSEVELVALAERELQPALGPRVPPRRSWVFRWPRAIAQYTAGHLERVADARARATRLGGLWLCGTSYDGVSFGSAVTSGRDLADRILEAG